MEQKIEKQESYSVYFKYAGYAVATLGIGYAGLYYLDCFPFRNKEIMYNFLKPSSYFTGPLIRLLEPNENGVLIISNELSFKTSKYVVSDKLGGLNFASYPTEIKNNLYHLLNENKYITNFYFNSLKPTTPLLESFLNIYQDYHKALLSLQPQLCEDLINNILSYNFGFEYVKEFNQFTNNAFLNFIENQDLCAPLYDKYVVAYNTVAYIIPSAIVAGSSLAGLALASMGEYLNQDSSV